VTNLLEGINGALLAYGQTSSGKTHSMFGPSAIKPQVRERTQAVQCAAFGVGVSMWLQRLCCWGSGVGQGLGAVRQADGAKSFVCSEEVQGACAWVYQSWGLSFSKLGLCWRVMRKRIQAEGRAWACCASAVVQRLRSALLSDETQALK